MIDAGVEQVGPGAWVRLPADDRGPGAFEGVAAAASATANSTAIASPVAWRASVSMRPPKRSFTHCSTNRLGAIRRSRPGLVGAGQRTDPGGELLGRELPLEREQAGGPRRGLRYGMHREEARRLIERLRRDATAVRLAGVAL